MQATKKFLPSMFGMGNDPEQAALSAGAVLPTSSATPTCPTGTRTRQMSPGA